MRRFLHRTHLWLFAIILKSRDYTWPLPWTEQQEQTRLVRWGQRQYANALQDVVRKYS